MIERAPRLFLSYSRDDRTGLLVIDDILRDLGYHTWWDAQLRSTNQIDAEIEAAMRAADAIVVLMSPAYARRDSYTQLEWHYARMALARTSLIRLLLQPVDRARLPLAMQDPGWPAQALTQLETQAALVSAVADACLAAGVTVPRGRPQGPAADQALVSTIDPPFDVVVTLDPPAMSDRIARLSRILSGTPDAPWHNANLALLLAHIGDHRGASQHMARAVRAEPSNARLQYLWALLATAERPLGPRTAAEMAAIWDACERSTRLDPASGLPHLLMAALAVDFYAARGSRPPVDPQTAVIRARQRSIDPSEYRRLQYLLGPVAPKFAALL